MAPAPLRIALYSPDRARQYDGRVREAEGVGGGITARLSLCEALARLGHDVTAFVNCEAPVTHAGVAYRPLDSTNRIDCDVLVAISTGGALSFAPMRSIAINAGRRVLWVQGVPKPADLDAVRADHVYVASNFLRNVCTERWRIPESQLFVCYNGLHQDYFRGAEQHSRPRDCFGIAYVGPPEKGLGACIAVLRLLRRIDDRFHLDVFGGGGLWGQDAGVPSDEPGLRFMGMLGQRELASALFGYEYCLALQAMEEGFGIAVQEAKRAGTIVIASPVGALPELIAHGGDGYLVGGAHTDSKTHRQVADLIATLEDDPLRRRRIRRRALTTPWSWDIAAKAWTEHWELLSRGANLPAIAELADGRHRLSDGAYFPVSRSHQVVLGGTYYGHGNLGDEAILSTLVDELGPEIDVVVATGDVAATARTHDVRTVDEHDVPALRRAIEASDLVVLGGGGPLHDVFGVDENTLLTSRHWGLTHCVAYPALARLAGKPFAVAAIGAGPLDTPAGRRLTRLIVDQADAGTVRDRKTLELLDAIGGRVERLSIAADPAFLLPSAESGWARTRLRGMGVPDEARLVAVAVRAWERDGFNPDEFEGAVSGALDWLTESHGMRTLLVPFEDPGDRLVAQRIRGRLRNPGLATITPPSLPACLVQALFGACDLLLAMRLHAVILGANAQVPLVALRYDDKVARAAKLIGLEEFTIDVNGISAQRLVDRAGAALADAPRIRATLQERLPELRRRAGETARVIRQVLTRESSSAPASSPEWDALLERARAALAANRVAWSVRRGRSPHRIVGRFLPAHWRRAIREAWQRRHLSPAAMLFERYRRARLAEYGSAASRVQAPGVPNLVSVVLPAFNGAAMIREAIDSVLAQTHSSLELIIVNDGSTDDTGAIADDYSRRDSRVRVIHQENRKLPAALTRGFEDARGEFLTWTSCDNRWKPRGLELLVGCLRRNPGWDVTYANLDLIGEDGRPLVGSSEYGSYQTPGGSGHVRLPDSTLELNTRPNNFVGAGFIYRSRVRFLIGGYSSARFGVEDYDYWMRANELLTVRKADFEDPVVEYRFHSGSLTAKSAGLGLEQARARLMIFDRFRRDLNLGPVLWVFDNPPTTSVAAALAQRVQRAGHAVYSGKYPLSHLPPAGLPIVFVRRGDRSSQVDFPSAAVRAELVTEPFPATFRFANGPERGDLVASNVDELFAALDVRAKSSAAASVEAAAITAPSLRASIVISAYRDHSALAPAIASAASQRLPSGQFEVIVVNNRPGDFDLPEISDFRTVVCPFPGVAAARNAGAAAARGAVVCFLDDDAIAEPGWLEAICRAFDSNPDVGVAGGPVLLNAPAPSPPAMTAGWKNYWSHFAPEVSRVTEIDDWSRFPCGANCAARREVLAAIGGFPISYGRGQNGAWPGGDPYGGGEELVAAALARQLGYGVAIVPDAIVHHHVSAERLTFDHVRKTMAARHLVAWRARRDLLEAGSSDLFRTIARLGLHHIDPRVRSWPHAMYDVAYRKSAQMQLLSAQWRDALGRWRRGGAPGP